MKFSRSSFFFISILVFLLAACGSAPNNSAPPSGATGVRVDTANGAYTNISPLELNAALAQKDFPLVNVHIPYEGEIEKTDVFIPYNEIEQNLNKLPPDKSARVVLYCRSGSMSKEAAEILVKLGYTNVWNLERGMLGWEQSGLPLVEKVQQP